MSALMTPGQQLPRKVLIFRALQPGDMVDAVRRWTPKDRRLHRRLPLSLERRPEDVLALTEEHLKELYAHVH